MCVGFHSHFCRILENLEVDVQVYRVKDKKRFTEVETRTPTERATDIAEFTLMVGSFLLLSDSLFCIYILYISL